MIPRNSGLLRLACFYFYSHAFLQHREAFRGRLRNELKVSTSGAVQFVNGEILIWVSRICFRFFHSVVTKKHDMCNTGIYGLALEFLSVLQMESSNVWSCKFNEPLLRRVRFPHKAPAQPLQICERLIRVIVVFTRWEKCIVNRFGQLDLISNSFDFSILTR